MSNHPARRRTPPPVVHIILTPADPYLIPTTSPLAAALGSIEAQNALAALRDPTPPSARPEEPAMPKHQMIAITPDMAYEYLTRNTTNRPIRQTHVDALARDMKEGRWRQTGAPIQFDTQGRLLDGQHRLAAIIEADITVVMLVVTGLEPEAQDVMDIGIRRTVGDALHIEGKIEHSPNVVAGIARAVLLLDNYRKGLGQQRPTQAEVLATARDQLDRFEEAAYIAGRARHAGLRGGILYGVAYYYLAAIDEDDAERFFEKLVSGADLHPGQPVYALRQKLIREAPRPSRQAQDIRHNLAYFFKAWNGFRRNKPILNLRIGANEPYPEPI